MPVTRLRVAAVAGAVLALMTGHALTGGTAAHADPPAGTVYVNGTTLYFEPGDGVANDVDIDPEDLDGDDVFEVFQIEDLAAPLTAGMGCTPHEEEPNIVYCERAGLISFQSSLGGEDDTLGVRGTLRMWVHGEGGTDWIDGSNGDDVLFGDSGDDTLVGWGGGDWLFGGSDNDTLIGYGGDDVFVGGLGADTFEGGPGNDGVEYYDHPMAVAADLDGYPGDDGAPGEGDTIRLDVENLTGSPWSDTLTGSSGMNVLTGGGGNDTIVGGLGSDRLHGGDGYDSLHGDNAPPPGTGKPPAMDWDSCFVGPGGGFTTGCEAIG
jgi:hypothetical protein